MMAQDILTVLVGLGKLTKEKAEEVRMKAVSLGKNVKDILTEEKQVDEESLVKAEATMLGIPYYGETEVVISPELLKMVPESLARNYLLIPIKLDKKEKSLQVMMVNPSDLGTIDFFQRRTGYKVEVLMVSLKNINNLFDKVYLQSLTGEVSEVLSESGDMNDDVGVKTVTRESLSEIIKEPKIVEIVKKVLEHAIRLRASDVHIEPEEEITRIRYRIDGILEEKLTLDKKYHAALISRIKILGGMKIDERRLPQDGRFNFESEDGEVDLRISSLPTVFGEKIVMRLLKKSGKVPSLPELGLRGRALKNLEQAVNIPHGIILITGPTGSGKTTTLYSMLTKINTPKVNIITLEDPVEYQMKGINQVQVNPQAGLTFASGLRSFLRQDPNIIMVGEIRDEETAALAVQASLTGHLVFSTIHTNSAAGALPRLLDMKVEPFLLASSMTAVVAQRVLRKTCDKCKVAYVPEKAVIEDMKVVLGGLYEGFIKSNVERAAEAQKNGQEILLYRGKGCAQCGNTGYLGRIGVFEVLIISEKIARLVMERADAGTVEKQAVVEGMITLKQDGYLKVLEGITTIEEVIRVAQV
ncbi:GspE/PulE family protein [Patescibacteria group bacterium]|nr:GspE/PulE family protein [Patescibacteria group bacterium]MBU1256833.1 GspE/PulE family protein [Patescibacteria group bacterium]MBU1457464.1 GspE/PulE family protein [Patescibacteria group bacterium]